MSKLRVYTQRFEVDVKSVDRACFSFWFGFLADPQSRSFQ